MIKFSPLVCGGISRNGEGLHRSQGTGMVLNDIIVSFLYRNKGEGEGCCSFGVPTLVRQNSFVFCCFLVGVVEGCKVTWK